jgi:hypothetical protein
VFSFVESQFHAVFRLAIDLLLMIAVRNLTAGERGELAQARPMKDLRSAG